MRCRPPTPRAATTVAATPLRAQGDTSPAPPTSQGVVAMQPRRAAGRRRHARAGAAAIVAGVVAGVVAVLAAALTEATAAGHVVGTQRVLG